MLRAEILALFAFAFVLPLFEAPKNLLWIAYIGLWVVNRWRTREFGGPWDHWDTLIVVWISSGYMSALFAGLNSSEWISALDVLRYASILWVLRRSNYEETVIRRLLAALVLGTLVTLAWGYYVYWGRIDVITAGSRHYLGLNSVGHVNHSAIYLAIAFGVAITWLRASWTTDGIATRAVRIALCLTFGMSLIVMESRATVAVGFVIGFAILGAYSLRTGKRVWMIIIGAALLAAMIFAAKPEVVEKNALRLNQNLFLAHRDTIWRTGLEGWRQYPLFGVGMGNYGRIDFNRLEEWSRAKGETLDRAQLRPTSHAHSLYVNTLVERGIVGLTVLLCVLSAWGWALARNMPSANDTVPRWTIWGGAFSAWLVTVLVGLVNTTLHHEHALISMLLLGGWFSLRRSRPISPRTVSACA